MPEKTIVIVEDESSLRNGLRLNLEEEGFRIIEYADADSAFLELPLLKSIPALAIFDVMMPGKLDGIELCKSIRKIGLNFPVIFLTARGRLEDKLEAFSAGGDDYLTKPFELEELIARVRARIGRKSVVRIGGGQLNLDENAAVSSEGKRFRLNEREVKILTLLIENRGKPVARDQILDRVWGGDFPSNRSIDNFIVKFRKIFEKDPANPVHFITRHGTGYELSND